MDRERILQELTHLTTCAICLSPFQDPRTLPCQHVFCLTCLQKQQRSQPSLACAVCRTPVVHGIPPAHSVTHIKLLDLIQRAEKPTVFSSLQCDICEHDSPAYWCSQCMVRMCPDDSAGHKRAVATKDHDVQTLEDMADRGYDIFREHPTCEHHKGQRYVVYSFENSRLGCSQCVLEGHSSRFMEIFGAASYIRSHLKFSSATALETFLNAVCKNKPCAGPYFLKNYVYHQRGSGDERECVDCLGFLLELVDNTSLLANLKPEDFPSDGVGYPRSSSSYSLSYGDMLATLLCDFCETNEHIERIEEVVSALHSLKSIDSFEKTYAETTISRWLRGAYMEHESIVMTLLARFMKTDRLEKLLKDVTFSRGMTGAYNCPQIDMLILTPRQWPVHEDMVCFPTEALGYKSSIRLPVELSKLFDSFNSFYTRTCGTRYLRLIPTLGQVTLLIDGVAAVDVSTFQAIVLLTFNERECWSLESLAYCIGCGNNMQKLEGIVESLDSFFMYDSSKGSITLRTKFDSFVVKHAPLRSIEDEKKKEVDNMDQVYRVESAIVRALKMEKSCIDKDKFISKLAKQLGVSNDYVLTRVTNLCDREYLYLDILGNTIVYRP